MAPISPTATTPSTSPARSMPAVLRRIWPANRAIFTTPARSRRLTPTVMSAALPARWRIKAQRRRSATGITSARSPGPTRARRRASAPWPVRATAEAGARLIRFTRTATMSSPPIPFSPWAAKGRIATVSLPRRPKSSRRQTWARALWQTAKIVTAVIRF